MRTVSVICLTFNHQEFIENALNGFLNQEFNGKAAFMFFDDCSKDSTGQKITIFIEKNNLSESFIFSKNKENIGANQNLLKAFLKSNASYIAYCEGDDYWIDPLKLQKQVDFLEENPEFSFCCSNIKTIDALSEEVSNAWPQKTHSFEISKRSLGMNIPFPSCSLVLRSSAFDKKRDLMNEMSDIPMPDFFLKSWLLSQGKGFFFQEKMAVYRQHAGGVYTSLNNKSRLEKIRATRIKFIFFCIKRGKWLSALICLKNTLRYPNF